MSVNGVQCECHMTDADVCVLEGNESMISTSRVAGSIPRQPKGKGTY